MHDSINSDVIKMHIPGKQNVNIAQQSKSQLLTIEIDLLTLIVLVQNTTCFNNNLACT